MQRRDALTKAANAVEPYHSETVAKTAPPWMEEVAGPESEASQTEPKPYAKTKASAKSEEGDVRRRPDRPISRDRSARATRPTIRH